VPSTFAPRPNNVRPSTTTGSSTKAWKRSPIWEVWLETACCSRTVMEVPAGSSSAGTNDRAVLLPCWSNGNECSSPGWPRLLSGGVSKLDWRAHATPSARSVTKQPIFRSRKQLIQWVETIFALQLSGHGNCHLGVKHLNDLPGCNGENHVFFALPRAYHKKQTERSFGTSPW